MQDMYVPSISSFLGSFQEVTCCNVSRKMMMEEEEELARNKIKA
jgi:hypothetical protein